MSSWALFWFGCFRPPHEPDGPDGGLDSRGRDGAGHPRREAPPEEELNAEELLDEVRPGLEPSRRKHRHRAASPAPRPIDRVRRPPEVRGWWVDLNQSLPEAGESHRQVDSSSAELYQVSFFLSQMHWYKSDPSRWCSSLKIENSAAW